MSSLAVTAVLVALVGPVALIGPQECPSGMSVVRLTESVALPDSAPRVLRDMVETNPLQLTREGAAVALLWPVIRPRERTSIQPAPLHPMPGTRQAFRGLHPGTRIGMLRVVGTAEDARGTAIPAGDYSLFYGVQPAFKDHLGTSTLRDFAVLMPARLDRGHPYEQRDLLAHIRVGSAAHALVLRVLPGGSTHEAAACKSELVLRASSPDALVGLTFDAASVGAFGSAQAQSAPSLRPAPYGPSFVAIRVRDAEAAASWYEETLELDVVRRIDDPDGNFTIRLLAGENAIVELIEQVGTESPPERHLGLFKAGMYVSNIEAFHRRLRSMDVDSDAAIFADTDLGLRSFVFRDPYGNRVQVFQECGAPC